MPLSRSLPVHQFPQCSLHLFVRFELDRGVVDLVLNGSLVLLHSSITDLTFSSVAVCFVDLSSSPTLTPSRTRGNHHVIWSKGLGLKEMVKAL